MARHSSHCPRNVETGLPLYMSSYIGLRLRLGSGYEPISLQIVWRSFFGHSVLSFGISTEHIFYYEIDTPIQTLTAVSLKL